MLLSLLWQDRRQKLGRWLGSIFIVFVVIATSETTNQRLSIIIRPWLIRFIILINSVVPLYKLSSCALNNIKISIISL